MNLAKKFPKFIALLFLATVVISPVSAYAAPADSNSHQMQSNLKTVHSIHEANDCIDECSQSQNSNTIAQATDNNKRKKIKHHQVVNDVIPIPEYPSKTVLAPAVCLLSTSEIYKYTCAFLF